MLTQLRRNWWILVIRGVAGVLFGIGTFVWPGLSVAVLVALFGAYAMADGLFAIGGSVRYRRYFKHWWLGLLQGLLGVAAALVAWLMPGTTALALLVVIAAWAVGTGVLAIVAAIRLRREIEDEWLLALSGASSVLLGVLLLIRPAAGALAVVWLIGIYAIMFGVLNVALGFSLRGIGRETVTTGPLPA